MEKMTYVSALTYVLDNCDLPVEVSEKLSNLRGQQGKRSTSGKLTAQQTANEGYKARILAFLSDGEKRTVSDLVKLVDWGEGIEMSVNRCSALVRQLKESGAIVREEISRKAYFYINKLAE